MLNNNLKPFQVLKKVLKRRRVCTCCLFLVLSIFISGCTASKAIQAGVDTVLGDIPAEDPVDVETVSADKIAYSQLSAEARKAYDQMLDCVNNYKEEITLSTRKARIMELAMEAMLADNPGIFWMNGYTYHTYQRGDKVVGLTFEPRYTMTQKSKEQKSKQIEDRITEWLADLPEDADDYQKSKYVFETLIDRVDYDKNAKDNQSIISVFLGGATVCQGYAEATAYLLDRLGVPSMVVSGTAANESHAWNYVILDGEGYIIDTTWGNSRYRGEGDGMKHVNYAYLNVTTAEIEKTHTARMMINVPECRSLKNNYYRREGLFFETYAQDHIGNTFSDAYYSGAKDISVKFASQESYEQTEDYFLSQGHIGEYCVGVGSVSYILGDDMRVITIEF